MGRPKGYDRDTVLEKAIELFWVQGYESTSTQQLVEHLGINRNSMYSEFGNKRAFFEAALRHYESVWVTRNFGPLEAPDARLETIYALFDHYAKIGQGRRWGMGCLLTNASVELGARDDASQDFSAHFIGRVTRAFENALELAQKAGEVGARAVAQDEARFLTSTWLGMLVLTRTKAPADVLDAVAVAVRKHLAALA